MLKIFVCTGSFYVITAILFYVLQVTTVNMSSLSKTETTVLQLMRTLNRPCSVNCLIEKGNSELGKSSIQKTLDMLVQDDKVIVKEYGKQKIYTIKRETQGDPEMVSLSANIEQKM